MFLGVLFLSIQSTYLFSFYLEVTIHYSFKYTKSFSCYVIFNEFFIVLWRNFILFFLGSEVLFIVFGVISLSWFCSLCEKRFTLLSIVIFLNVIYFKENINNFVSFDSTNSKQQLKNQFVRLLSSKLYINKNLHNRNLFYLSDLVFCIRIINNVHFVL